MHVLRLPAQTRVARPWRNGGGITRDIAIFPGESGDDEFLWRASIATITDVGPFSSWLGIDRTLLVLRGELALEIEARREIQMDENTSSLAFAGENQVVAKPLGIPCLVLNIMVRRDRTRFRLMRQLTALPIDADQTLLLATQATMISVHGLSFHLDETDAVLFEPLHSTTIKIDPSIVILEFENNLNL